MPKSGNGPLDGGYGWMIVIAGLLINLVFGMIVRVLGVYYLQFLDEFGADATTTAWSIALATMMWNGLGVVTTTLCSRFSERIIAIIGGVLLSVGMIGSAFTTHIGGIFVTFGFCLGCGLSFVYMPSYMLVTEYFDQWKSRAIAIVSTGSSVGAFVGAPLLTYLFSHYGYCGGFLIMGAVSLHCCVAGALFRPFRTHLRMHKVRLSQLGNRNTELVVSAGDMSGDVNVAGSNAKKPEDLCLLETNKSGGLHSPSGSARSVQSVEYAKLKAVGDLDASTGSSGQTRDECFNSVPSLDPRAEPLIPLADACTTDDCPNGKMPQFEDPSVVQKHKKQHLDWSVLRHKPFIFFIVVMVTCSMAFSIGVTFLPAMAQEKGVSPNDAALLLSLLAILDGLTRIPMGILIDVESVKPYRVVIYFVMAGTIGVFTALKPLCSGFIGLAVLASLRGLSSCMFMPQRMTVLLDMFGPLRAPSAFGFLMVSCVIGGIMARTFGGLCKDYLGYYDPVFYVAGTLVAIASFSTAAALFKLTRHKLRAEAVNKASEGETSVS